MLISVVWLKVCSLIGEAFIHSIEDEMEFVLIIGRVALKLSQMIHINIIMDKNEIKDPKEEIIFQVVKASG